jgi:ubiquinone/menaquinone biosynthesis C-methylase UbiE
MKRKHLATRPEMFWDLGDMTAMTDYSDGIFDVVFDKGALDALMSTNDSETNQKATMMFKEIDRVLAPGGKYICITLAEDYILRAVISRFTGIAGWNVEVETIQNGKPSPFIPFYIVISKTAGATSLRLRVDYLGNEAAPQVVAPSVAIEKVRSFDIDSLEA